MENRKIATFVCTHVFNKTHPILYVSRTDGDWQFLCGKKHIETEIPHIISLEEVIESDCTIQNIIDLPEEWMAERITINDTWETRPLYNSMSEEDFEKYIDECYMDLENKQNYLRNTFNFSKFESYWYDQEKEIFQLKNNDIVELEFNFIEIGSFNNSKKTWMWCWANNSNSENQMGKSEILQELFYLTGYDIFKNPKFESDETMAWEIVAICSKFLNSIGIYRIPHGDLQIFIALFNKD